LAGRGIRHKAGIDPRLPIPLRIRAGPKKAISRERKEDAMIEISPERKSASRSKPLVRIGVACMLAAAAAAAAASQIPAFARALTFARFAALGATVGLGVSIASLLAGAILIRGPVAANAVKFGSMALMIVSLGILVGACNQSSSVSLISGTLGS